ncbi:DUF4190 domain-containing protein [Streptomyces sp. NPDC006700]|uniref:DUF4190 domain-containing protein n=1 Tax=Streptomyces sp. NPDC006700 TaxID=3154479 RepID=UPI00340EDEE3
MASLVCLAPLGLIFGIVALVRISRNGQRGKGLAIAGISVSGAFLLPAALVARTADFKVWTLPGRDSDGETAPCGAGWARRATRNSTPRSGATPPTWTPANWPSSPS